jgi:hypothetical protein
LEEEKMTNKKLLEGILGILLVFSLVLMGCPTDSPEDDEPVQITTAEGLDAVRNNLSRRYILAADIDLASYANFVPIGTFVPRSEAQEDQETPNLELAFTGVFDGNGHKISNVTISAPMQAGVGLFGCVAGDNGAVKNLVVENVTVSGYMLVSGVIGYGEIKHTIENITLQGDNSITGTVMVGGIVGGGFCEIKNSSASADIILTEGDEAGAAGILAGGMEDGSIISCTVTGGSISAVAGSFGIGGLAGCCAQSPEVKDCAVTNVTINAPASAERIGGIIGSGFYTSAYAAMASMPGYEFLGAPGAFTVTNSASSGSIAGGCTDLVGKIAGYIYDNSTVETCTSTMTGATNNVGGDKNSAAPDTLK